MGRTFTNPPIENPFLALDREVTALREETPVIFVDFHAEATSEKIAMGRFLDGRVSAVIGTHTHVQTADETIFPGGTAYLTDAGMCGPEESVIGSEIQPVLRRFLTSMPVRFSVASGPVLVCGALVEIDPATGRALRITRIRERWEPAPAAS
jgi:metallophosphoesterase (TIGR00282 family)